MLSHPAVAECGVVGAPDEARGMIVKAYVVVASGFDAESCPTPTIGERVHILSGPLAGVSGVLTERRSSLRLIVSVELIHRSISVEVTPSMLAQSWEALRKAEPDVLRFVAGT